MGLAINSPRTPHGRGTPAPGFNLVGGLTATAGAAQTYTVTGTNLVPGTTYTGSLVGSDTGMGEEPASFNLTSVSPQTTVSVQFAAAGVQTIKAQFGGGQETNEVRVTVAPTPTLIASATGQPVVGEPFAVTVVAANITAPYPVTPEFVGSANGVLSPGTITPEPGALSKLFYLTAALAGAVQLRATGSAGAVVSNTLSLTAAPAPTPPPPPPPGPTTATLALPTTATTGVAINGTVTLDAAALSNTTCNLAISNGGTLTPSSPVVLAGQTSIGFTASWPAAGAGRTVTLNSTSPSLTPAGSPRTVAVSDPPAGDPPTQAALWADLERTTTATPIDAQVALDAPAQTAYTVTWLRAGASVSTSTIPVGGVGAIAPVDFPSAGAVDLDFTISPSLTRLRRPLAITVHDTAARLVTEFADVAFAGKWDLFYIKNIGASATTFAVSGTSGATFSPTSGTIPAGEKIRVGFKKDAAGATDITVTSPAPIVGATKTVTVGAYTAPTVPAAAGGDYERIYKPIVEGNQINFERWYSGEAAYDRWCKPLLVSPTANTVGFHRFSHTGGGRLNFNAGEVYELRMWERPPTFAGSITLASLGPGTTIATHTVVGTSTAVRFFTVNLTGFTEGWKLVDIVGPSGTCGVPFWMYVMLGSVPVDQDTMPWLPTATHSFDLHFNKGGGTGLSFFHLHRVPNRVNALVVPLARRETPHFQDFPADRTQFTCTSLTGAPSWPVETRTVVESGPSTELAMGAGGLLRHTFNEQYYYYFKLFRANPLYAINDGPRGDNNVWGTTVVDFGVALPGNTGYRGNIYCCDPHHLFKIDREGKKTSLAGYKHKHPPRRWLAEDVSVAQQDYDLVGDWSAIPSARWGYHELWALAWDERTLPINTAVAPLPAEQNQQPHVLPVVAFLTDTQNNRVTKQVFADSAATSSNPRHGGTVRVTEFITGMSDPWGMVFHNGRLYVTERLAHRISEWDADTGAFIRTVISGPALGGVASDRHPFRTASLATVQAVTTCVGPEGLVKFIDENGVFWLIFGSWMMSEIRAVRPDTGEVRVLLTTANNAVILDNNSFFMHLAISDGTFGARGSLFLSTWSAANSSGSGPFPEAYKYLGNMTWSRWQYYLGNDYTEPGLQWPSNEMGYPVAAGVGDGKLAWGGAMKGVRILSRKLASDTFISNWRDGRTEWVNEGWAESHGNGGFSPTGLAIPWGSLNAAKTAYLVSHGHVPP